jgi:DNA gyrase/topoisomerase IV subunit A
MKLLKENKMKVKSLFEEILEENEEEEKLRKELNDLLEKETQNTPDISKRIGEIRNKLGDIRRAKRNEKSKEWEDDHKKILVKK